MGGANPDCRAMLLGCISYAVKKRAAEVVSAGTRREWNRLHSTTESAGIRRTVVKSTAFLFRDAVLPSAHLVWKLFFATVVADASGMEEVFRTSGLDLPSPHDASESLKTRRAPNSSRTLASARERCALTVPSDMPVV
ncbi:MAG TPA: hypothetical protein VGS27_13795 [Candidatus Sulfotelmatobacter sp.]|nr:hypothetical protein [Candidatus Sulfotelmatobacter sp.]